jgi:hypothetical protein
MNKKKKNFFDFMIKFFTDKILIFEITHYETTMSHFCHICIKVMGNDNLILYPVL